MVVMTARGSKVGLGVMMLVLVHGPGTKAVAVDVFSGSPTKVWVVVGDESRSC